MKIFITRKALKGIVEAEAPMVAGGHGMARGPAILEDGTTLQGYEWCEALAEAEEEFNRQKAKKLVEMAGKFKRLGALKMRVVKAKPRVRVSKDSQTQGCADAVRK